MIIQILTNLNGLFSKHLKIFTCITFHQTPVTTDPRKRHCTSISKLVGCYHICLFPIPVQKNLWTTYKSLKENDYSLTKYVIPPLTRTNIETGTANYKAFYRSLELFFSKTQLSSLQQNQNHTSRLPPTLTMIMYLISLCQLSLT